MTIFEMTVSALDLILLCELTNQHFLLFTTRSSHLKMEVLIVRTVREHKSAIISQ